MPFSLSLGADAPKGCEGAVQERVGAYAMNGRNVFKQAGLR